MMRAVWKNPIKDAGEEIDFAIEFSGSLVNMALDLGDLDWAAEAQKVYRILLGARDLGIGEP